MIQSLFATIKSFFGELVLDVYPVILNGVSFVTAETLLTQVLIQIGYTELNTAVSVRSGVL